MTNTTDAPTATPDSHRQWVQPIDRMLLYILLALEIGSFAMVSGVVLATGAPWWMLPIVLVSMAAPIVLIGFARLTVWLDERGVRYVFRPFWRGTIPYHSIENVEVLQRIDPLGQFGGWGPKPTLKGFGLIAKGGPGIKITRFKKTPVIITTSDADGLAAAILERLLEAAGAPPDAEHA